MSPELNKIRIKGFLAGIDLVTGQYNEPEDHIMLTTDPDEFSKEGGLVDLTAINREEENIRKATAALDKSPQQIRLALNKGKTISW